MWDFLKQALWVYVIMGVVSSLISSTLRGQGGSPPAGGAAPSSSARISHAITLEDARRLTFEKQRQAEEQHRSMQAVASHAGVSIPFTPAQRVFPTVDAAGTPLGPHLPLLLPGSKVDLRVFVTPSRQFDYARDAGRCVWHLKDVLFGWGYSDTPHGKARFEVTESFLRNNESLFAHVLVTAAAPVVVAMDPSSAPDAPSPTAAAAVSESDALAALLSEPSSLLVLEGQEATPAPSGPLLFYRLIPLITYRAERQAKRVRSLLSNASLPAPLPSASASSSEPPPPPRAFFTPTLNLSLVLDMPAFPRNSVPPTVARHMHFEPEGRYQPIIYHNRFWQTSKTLVAVNDSLLCPADSSSSNSSSGCGALHLGMSYSHISFFYWQLQASMEDQWSSQQASGMGTERESDMMREMLLETSPWLLGLTAVVSLLHTVFDMLAFKNDVQFWRKKKSMAGMSVRSLVVNCFFQTIILLYLFDNDTSYMILLSSCLGLAIEYWKLSKAFTFQLTWPKGGGLGLPTMTYQLSASYTTGGGSSTEKIDAEATTHLLHVLVPLMLGYSAFSLVHSQHKGFYSWAVGSLVGFVYAFGFVLMTPQLWINYRLRSVAHMPWKALTYKALNTVIDDLFSFIIKVRRLSSLGPLAHVHCRSRAFVRKRLMSCPALNLTSPFYLSPSTSHSNIPSPASAPALTPAPAPCPQMPTMHRLACFRDDAIFLVYLYQKWTYPEDRTRANEYGQGGEEEGAEGAEEGDKGLVGAAGAEVAEGGQGLVQGGATQEKAEKVGAGGVKE